MMMKIVAGVLLTAVIGVVMVFSGILDDVIVSMVPRPQHPKSKERDYIIEEVLIEHPTEDILLAGELTYPKEMEPRGGIVLISGWAAGEAPGDRDSALLGHKPFLVISHMLTERGYAVLRYDNRGVGGSTGEYEMATDDHYASDAAAVMKWLKEESGLSLDKTGYIGHSQGGVKGPMAAKIESPDFMAFLGGPAANGIEDFINQHRDSLVEQKQSGEVIEVALNNYEEIVEILVESENREEALELVKAFCIEQGETDEKQINAILEIYVSPIYYTNARRDIEQLIRDFEGPILALYGDKDRLVSAEVNAEPMKSLVVHPMSKVHTYEGLNHMFQETEIGGVEEYWKIQQTIAPYVIEDIDTWIRSLD